MTEDHLTHGPRPTMEHEITEEGELVIITLKGEIDLEYSARAREIVLNAITEFRSILVDLSGVSMVDSSGIASMLEGHQTARKLGKDFILVAVGSSVMRVLKLARLETIFEIADDLAEAKKSIT